jgi:hypothetical protein
MRYVLNMTVTPNQYFGFFLFPCQTNVKIETAFAFPQIALDKVQIAISKYIPYHKK